MVKRRILLVEDDKDIADVLKDILENYEVTVALDGIYGLKIIRHVKPDLVIVDLNLPRMKGDEFIDKIKYDPKLSNIPIVVISGTFNQTFEGGLTDGVKADAVFSKPLDVSKFVKKIEKLL